MYKCVTTNPTSVFNCNAPGKDLEEGPDQTEPGLDSAEGRNATQAAIVSTHKLVQVWTGKNSLDQETPQGGWFPPWGGSDQQPAEGKESPCTSEDHAVHRG